MQLILRHIRTNLCAGSFSGSPLTRCVNSVATAYETTSLTLNFRGILIIS